MNKVIMAALLCCAVCAGCNDSACNDVSKEVSDLTKEVKQLRSVISKLRSEVHELRRRGESRMPDVRTPMRDAESRKKFEAEHKARMEDRRRMHEERRREMEELRKNRVAPAAPSPADAPAK